MALTVKIVAMALAVVLTALSNPIYALEIQHFIEGKKHAGLFADAKGLKISDQGVVYVTSEEKATILKITDGKIEVIRLSPSVFKNSDLGGIDILANGKLVVVNEGVSKIAVLNSDFSRHRIFSKSGDDPGELDDPMPVAVSANNRIYVGDVGNKQISVFNHQGLFLYSIGRHGSRTKDLLKPTHIGLDAEENVYVLEGINRFSIFDLAGNLIVRIKSKELKELFGDTPEFTAMAVDLNGLMYLADAVTSQITILDWRERKVIKRFGALGQSRTQYRNITQLSVNNVGQIAILDKKNKKVEVFQLDETQYKTPIVTDLLRAGGIQKPSCRALYAFIQEKTLCVKTGKNGIVVLSPEGKEIGAFASEVKEPSALHTGPNSVGILQGNKLYAYAHNGDALFTVGRYGTSPGGFKKPRHVFVHDDQYYVSDNGNSRIQIFSRDGQFLEEIKSEREDGKKLFYDGGPIAVDSHKNIYIADKSKSGLIKVIDKQRVLVNTIGDKRDSIHKVTRFRALDIDNQDRLYVLTASKFNGNSVRIYKDSKLYKTFGSSAKNGTEYYFDEVGSLSVASGATNTVHIYDKERKKHFRFDLLEYPDAAFGLTIASNKVDINLEWSSSKSPLIAKYEIQGSGTKQGPFERITSTTNLKEVLPVKIDGKYAWFRIVSVSEHGLRATPSAPKENQFQKINALFKAGNFTEVVKLADRLLKIAPANADARDVLAESLFNLKDYTRAISEYKLLEKTDSYRNKAIKYQVQAYFELEQYLDARALIDEVIALEPPEVDPYLICTRLSLKLADAIGAVTCAEDGLLLHADNVDLRYLLGRAYIEAGIADEGFIAYQTIVNTHPDNYALRLKIADDIYALKDYEKALAHYDYVSTKLTGSGAAAVGKARSLLSLNRDDEAKSIAVKLSGNKETKGDGYYLLGKIAAKQGKHKEAVLRLTRAGKDKPEVIDAWVSLAQAYIQINQLSRGVKALKQGIKHNPEAFELFALAGKIELEDGHFPEANSYLDQAVALQPQSLQAQKLYASGLYATRNYRTASIHAEAAARIAPEDIDVLILQADIANKQGKTGSAIEFLKTAISSDPASADLQYRIGRVYQEANLFDASRNHLEKAASINPSWAEPVVALGNLYIKRRLFDDAISAFEKAIELNPSDENRAILNVAFAERKKSLEFKNNAPQLLLSDLNLQTVFSAAYKNYLKKPIGQVKLQNVSATDYGNLKLSFQIREYMDFPSSIEIPMIKGNETQQLDIYATFNNKILEVDEDTGVQVEVKLSYLRDGQKDDITLTQPMTIYGKNAIVWGDSAMIGSFVTPKDDTLRNYVRQVVNTFQPDAGPLNDKLVSAMAYFSSLTASGTNYIIDPNTPFTELRDDQIDYVQFPRETLRLKSGDCDDLSVLLSAGLENLGIKTSFVEVPGHLFMMFDTGIAVDDSGLISQDSSLLAIKDGNVWIPLEATMVNSSFSEAWAEGARKYHKALEENILGIIDLNEAWKTYKPVTLQKAGYSIPLPESKRTLSLVKQAKKVLLEKSINRLVLPYQTMVVNNPKNISARLQIAILYARFGLYEDAEIAFEALNELAPDNSGVQTNQGNLYFLQEDFKRAIDSYDRAFSLDSADGGILINLSMAHYKAGDLKQATANFQMATKLDASLSQQYNAYSKMLSQ